jgi:hypothetical protein
MTCFPKYNISPRNEACIPARKGPTLAATMADLGSPPPRLEPTRVEVDTCKKKMCESVFAHMWRVGIESDIVV